MGDYIDFSALDVLSDNFKKAKEKMPERIKKFHEDVADDAKRAVDRAIDSTLNDGRNTIKNMQVKDTGHSSGYAKVRPKGVGENAGAGQNSPGAITRYTDKGHRIRPPGDGENYRPRIKVPYVHGREYYAKARAELQGSLAKHSTALTEEIKADLEE